MPPVVSTSTLSPDADRVAILVNPKAGPIAAQPGADRLAGLLEKRGYKVEVFTNLAAATSQANRWHAEGCLRTLVGVGGDGTAAELVNRTDEGLPLTLFPGGNSNLLARYLQMTKDPEFLCRTIVEGIVARLDAGRANGRIFLLMIGCGFDAEVVNRVHANRTGHISLKNYFRPVGEALWNYRYPEIQASWEEDEGTVPILRQRKWDCPPAATRLVRFRPAGCSSSICRVTAGDFASRPSRTAPTACWTCADSAAAVFGGTWRRSCSVGIIARPIGWLAAGGGCGSPPRRKSPIRSTAIPAEGCRWMSRCCQGG